MNAPSARILIATCMLGWSCSVAELEGATPGRVGQIEATWGGSGSGLGEATPEEEHLWRRVAAAQQGLLDGSWHEREVLAFALEVLDRAIAVQPRPTAPGWAIYDIQDGPRGSVDLRMGQGPEGATASIYIETPGAPYLDAPVDAADSQLMLFFGWSPQGIDYCAVASHARVLATQRTVIGLEGRVQPYPIGATLELRDGRREHAEVLLEASRLSDGRPIATSLIGEAQAEEAEQFEDLPELEHLTFMLSELSRS